MLRRPEGATVEQIAAATGWQWHTNRPWPASSPPCLSIRTGLVQPNSIIEAAI
jgi:hypothetical protein